MADGAVLQREFFAMLMESQYWRPDRMVEFQRTHLERLLRHARANVPFYANRLDAVFTGSASIDWDRWHEIPILTRDDLLHHREATLSRSLPTGHGKVTQLSTTGSTGTPITVSHSAYSGMVVGATMFRAHTWHGLDWSQNLLAWVAEGAATAGGQVEQMGRPWGPKWEPSAALGRAAKIDRFVTPEQVLEYVLRNDIKYVTTRPKRAQLLAQEAIRDGGQVRLGAILTYSTATLPDERDDCRRAFGCEMIGPYSSKEAHHMAYQCPTGYHHHINAEAALVEVLDDDGQPCSPGQMGRVVVTCIFNAAQPIIRYDQGDMAIAGAVCNCGRNLPVIERIVGRSMHLFRFPDGSKVAPLIPESCRDVLGARFWQFAQIAPLHVEVRYVPLGDRRGDEESVAAIVRQRTHPDVTVTFRQQPDLVRVLGGKYVEYVCELDASLPASRQS